MKIVVEGCAHGELEKIYDAISQLEQRDKIKVDLLICCGDFQATRNEEDLDSMAVPKKYRQMCTFYKYYNGEKIAPVLTLFIGGNHEASNHLQELPYGGWAAPNIFYMGYAGVVQFGGIRIAGISGIYKPYDYSRGHFERPPYNDNTRRSVYHVRNVEVFRLKQMKSPIDICLSHDWPRGIHKYGNVDRLLRDKPFFQDDISSNSLGSVPCEELLFHLKPRYWFAAHLHCKFSALVPHENDEDKCTRFLALDKCLPRRKFLQVVDIPHNEEEELCLKYDLEWLTILHYSNHLTSIKNQINPLPAPGCDERWIFTPTEEEKEFILTKLGGDLRVPLNFQSILKKEGDHFTPKKGRVINHQTIELCEKLGIDDPMSLFETSVPSTPTSGTATEQNDLSYSEDVSFIDSGNENSFLVTEADKEDLEESSPSKGRISMQLPPPKFDSGNNSLEEILDTKNGKPDEKKDEKPEVKAEQTNLFVIDELPKRNLDEPTSEAPVATTKKFKRRNQAIYGQSED